MSTMSSVIAVGLDLGSQNCRAAINGRGVVSNTQGHRWTTAIVAKEEEEEEENGGQQQQQQQQQQQGSNSNSAKSFVFGDAAARLSHDKVRDVIGEETAEAYIKYMLQLCVDNASCTADQLKIVLSVPVQTDTETKDQTETETEESNKKLKEMIEKVVKTMIPDKKKRKQEFCVGLISEPAAICVANNVLQSNNNNNNNILVIDAGASGLKLTRLHQTTNGMLFQKAHHTLSTISGPALLKLLAQHVATQFERQSRIPRGEVWESKKARTKLLKEAERVLLGSANSSLSFTIDGLYEGMDCHVNVSKPRWDMMTAPLLRPVQAKLQQMVTDNDNDNNNSKIDTVLCAGPWVSLLDATIKKMFPAVKRETVIPEEAVVMGCAIQAALSTKDLHLVCPTPTLRVPVSPVNITITPPQNDHVVLIPIGAPLPCRVTHALSQPAKLIARSEDDVVLAELNDIAEETVMTLELSVEGQLSIQFPGEPIVTI